MYLEKEQEKTKGNMYAGKIAFQRKTRRNRVLSVKDNYPFNSQKSLQLMAYVKTRPLGQQESELDTDWNIGFGNLKYNHRHLIFDNQHDEIAHKSSTQHKDNIGFHAEAGSKKIDGGKGELFGENVRNYGYTERETLYNEIRAVEAVSNIPVPPLYHILNYNCQDYVSSVLDEYDRLGGNGN